MIAAFSTSSPWASTAILSANGEVVWHDVREASHQAGGACLAMLEAARQAIGFELLEIEAYAADIGPGSFTGVRVGVMLAKSFAFLFDRPVLGADSFDLIDPKGIVVLPSKRGEYFVRRPGGVAIRSSELPAEPFRGFGPGVEPATLPDAVRFAPLVAHLPRVSAIEFVPRYLIEPSISTPKRPFAEGRNG